MLRCFLLCRRDETAAGFAECFVVRVSGGVCRDCALLAMGEYLKMQTLVRLTAAGILDFAARNRRHVVLPVMPCTCLKSQAVPVQQCTTFVCVFAVAIYLAWKVLEPLVCDVHRRVCPRARRSATAPRCRRFRVVISRHVIRCNRGTVTQGVRGMPQEVTIVPGDISPYDGTVPRHPSGCEFGATTTKPSQLPSQNQRTCVFFRYFAVFFTM